MSKEKETNRKSFKKSGLIFLLLVLIMLGFVFKSVSPQEIIHSFKKLDPLYFIFGMLCMGIYCIADAINIRRPLKTLGYDTTYLQAIKYEIIGFFFSYITPSATGGQPVQMYYMYYDDIKLSHSTLSLMLQLIGHETAITIYAIIGFITQYEILSKAMGNAKYILLVGIVINFLVDSFLLSLIFFRKVTEVIRHFIIWLTRKISSRAADRVEDSISSVIADYENSAEFMSHHPDVIYKSIATAFVQMFGMFLVPYMVYRGFGFHTYSWFQVFMLEAVLFVAVGFLPLPGAVGASEGLFYIIFSVLYPASLLTSAMLITRCINLYFCLGIDGLLILYFTHRLHQKKRARSISS